MSRSASLRERRRELAPARGGGGGAIDQLVEIVHHRVDDPGLRVRLQLSPLASPVVTEQVRSDAVEPAAQGPRLVEAFPAVIGDNERLGGEIVGQGAADPPSKVAVQRRMLLPERLAEVAAHINSFPLAGPRFPHRGLQPGWRGVRLPVGAYPGEPTRSVGRERRFDARPLGRLGSADVSSLSGDQVPLSIFRVGCCCGRGPFERVRIRFRREAHQ